MVKSRLTSENVYCVGKGSQEDSFSSSMVWLFITEEGNLFMICYENKHLLQLNIVESLKSILPVHRIY